MPFMPLYPSARTSCLASATRKISAVVVLAGGCLLLMANTAGSWRTVPVAGCYCGCERTAGAGSCVKMCDLPKYSSRWWATSCKKPRALAPKENPGAGPRLRHADHAERAQL
jgi:hypothetical protein